VRDGSRVCEQLTLADAGGVANSGSRLLGTAGLLGAVTDTVSPVGLGAEAALVILSALELGLGNGGHVANAELLLQLALARDGIERSGDQRTAHCPRFWAAAAPAKAAMAAKDFILRVGGEGVK
jgi:hypothetical protein